jgi:hypothetical protein
MKLSLTEIQKQREAEPTRDSALAAFGERNYAERINPATGRKEWKVKVRGEKARGLMKELYRPYARIATERGEKIAAQTVHVNLKTRDGQPVVVREELADHVARRDGLHSARPYRGRPMRSHEVFANGHIHLGEPWPHQMKICPGCREKRRRRRG